MIRLKKIFFIAAFPLLAAWCLGPHPVQGASLLAGSTQHGAIPVGEGQFTIQVARGPMNVFTYRPRSFTANSPVWVVIHGARRDVAVHSAFDYYDVWIKLAGEAGALLLVPEFVEHQWPTSWQFQFGNVRTRSLEPIRWQDSGFGAVETAFRQAVAMAGSSRHRFSIYGHGAGAQWVQRYVLHSGGRYVERAIAANPGWYLLPDDEFAYPYGLKKAPIPQGTLRQALGTRFVILLGQDDRRTTGIIRDNKQTRAQGANRYERGHFYFKRASTLARRIGAPFAWQLREVPGAGHENEDMAPAAAGILQGR